MGTPLKVTFDIDSTAGLTYSADGRKRACGIEVTEQVIVKLQWKHICRGAISVTLMSPSGTSAIVLDYRANDSYAGNGAMKTTSVAQWGEIITGRWRVEVGPGE